MMSSIPIQTLLISPFLLALLMYLYCVRHSNRKYRRWPIYRTLLMILGCGCAIVSLIGPIPHLSHTQFQYHMLGHWLLGMLGPLCIVLAMPITLLLRTLPVEISRKLTRIVHNRYFYWITDPVVASLLNVGALWVLYTTIIFEWMHHSLFLYTFIHIHMFIAGYVNTVSFIYIDPFPYRRSYLYRLIVMILAMASHSILAKWIVAHPPAHVPYHQAEIGGMIMYYGGNLVDIVIITIFCLRWYVAQQKVRRKLAYVNRSYES